MDGTQHIFPFRDANTGRLYFFEHIPETDGALCYPVREPNNYNRMIVAARPDDPEKYADGWNSCQPYRESGKLFATHPIYVENLTSCWPETITLYMYGNWCVLAEGHAAECYFSVQPDFVTLSGSYTFNLIETEAHAHSVYAKYQYDGGSTTKTCSWHTSKEDPSQTGTADFDIEWNSTLEFWHTEPPLEVDTYSLQCYTNIATEEVVTTEMTVCKWTFHASAVSSTHNYSVTASCNSYQDPDEDGTWTSCSVCGSAHVWTIPYKQVNDPNVWYWYDENNELQSEFKFDTWCDNLLEWLHSVEAWTTVSEYCSKGIYGSSANDPLWAIQVNF